MLKILTWNYDLWITLQSYTVLTNSSTLIWWSLLSKLFRFPGRLGISSLKRECSVLKESGTAISMSLPFLWFSSFKFNAVLYRFTLPAVPGHVVQQRRQHILYFWVVTNFGLFSCLFQTWYGFSLRLKHNIRVGEVCSGQGKAFFLNL